MSKSLPAGWATSPIGDLCLLINGKAFKPSDWSDSGLPIIRIQNLNNVAASFNNYNKEIDDKFVVENGQLLFAWSGTPGTSFGAHIWNGGKAVLNQHIFKVEFNEDFINKRFFCYAINQKLDELINIAHGGVGLRHVTKGKFEGTEVSIPPLNEQKRISNKLDELLAAVDACKARLDKVSTILKRLRQSVIAAATSGELTANWRLENVADQWINVTLENLIQEKPRNGYSPKSVDRETSVKSLTLTATTSGKFKPEYFKYIDAQIPQDSHLWLEDGDILIQRANTIEYVGISAIYRGPDKTFIYPDLMMKVKSNNKALTEYLHYCLLSENVRSYFRRNATGSAGNMPKINQKIVMAAPIPLPSIEEQKEIVRRVKDLFAVANQLEAKVTVATNRVERLAQSILAKAFRGELVPQDPNDEPAEKLLERIKKYRATQIELKKVRKPSDRRVKMPELDKNTVKKAINEMADDQFSFDELRETVSADYETLKDILFSLLEETEPILQQVFDQEEKGIRFVRSQI